VRAAKESTRKSSAREENINKEKKKRLPVTVDFIVKSREVFWMSTDIDNKMIYMGLVIAFNFMLRASEYIMESNGSNHTLLTDDVLFLTSDVTVKYKTWELTTVRSWRITSILFVIRSSKADRTGKGRYLYLSRKSMLEGQLVDDVIEWAQLSRTKANEPFLSRWLNNKHKKVTRRMMTEGLRTVARTFKFSETMVFAFQLHSLRIGGATSRMACGGSREVTKRMGGWSYDSSCDELYYLNTSLDEGALSMSRMNMELFSMDQVHQLIGPSRV
jgi:hypothetical protein